MYQVGQTSFRPFTSFKSKLMKRREAEAQTQIGSDQKL